MNSLMIKFVSLFLHRYLLVSKKIPQMLLSKHLAFVFKLIVKLLIYSKSLFQFYLCKFKYGNHVQLLNWVKSHTKTWLKNLTKINLENVELQEEKHKLKKSKNKSLLKLLISKHLRCVNNAICHPKLSVYKEVAFIIVHKNLFYNKLLCQAKIHMAIKVNKQKTIVFLTTSKINNLKNHKVKWDSIISWVSQKPKKLFIILLQLTVLV